MTLLLCDSNVTSFPMLQCKNIDCPLFGNVVRGKKALFSREKRIHAFCPETFCVFSGKFWIYAPLLSLFCIYLCLLLYLCLCLCLLLFCESRPLDSDPPSPCSNQSVGGAATRAPDAPNTKKCHEVLHEGYHKSNMNIE